MIPQILSFTVYECTGRIIAHSLASVLAKFLNLYIQFFCDGQGADRQAILYADRSYFEGC